MTLSPAIGANGSAKTERWHTNCLCNVSKWQILFTQNHLGLAKY